MDIIEEVTSIYEKLVKWKNLSNLMFMQDGLKLFDILKKENWTLWCPNSKNKLLIIINNETGNIIAVLKNENVGIVPETEHVSFNTYFEKLINQ